MVRRLTSTVAAALAVALTAGGCSEKQAPPQGRPAVPVTVSPAVEKDVPVDVRVVGTVEAYSTVAVRSLVSGELKQVHFTEGRDVHEGDLLFSIDPRTFQSDLRRAEANLERDLAGSRQAEANLERDRAQQRNAEVETRRYQRLTEQGILSKQEYERVRTNSEALEAVLRADQAAIDNIQQSIKADRAAIENARIQLGYCTIRSPLSGRTGSLMVHSGNLVRANDTLLITINRISPTYVSFAVPEQMLPEIKRYMGSGKLRVEAIPPSETRTLAGTVTFINNAVDPATGTIRLKGSFANEDRRLWPGQFVDVVLTLTTQRGAVVVPPQAVQTGQQGTYVFVVRGDRTVELRPVVLGRTRGSDAVIDRGLTSGEQVVTDGHLRLMPGARVETKAAEAASEPRP